MQGLRHGLAPSDPTEEHSRKASKSFLNEDRAWEAELWFFTHCVWLTLCSQVWVQWNLPLCYSPDLYVGSLNFKVLNQVHIPLCRQDRNASDQSTDGQFTASVSPTLKVTLLVISFHSHGRPWERRTA